MVRRALPEHALPSGFLSVGASISVCLRSMLMIPPMIPNAESSGASLISSDMVPVVGSMPRVPGMRGIPRECLPTAARSIPCLPAIARWELPVCSWYRSMRGMYSARSLRRLPARDALCSSTPQGGSGANASPRIMSSRTAAM